MDDPTSGVDPLGLSAIVRTVPPTSPETQERNEHETWAAISSGRIYTWAAVTESTTGTVLFDPKPVVSGNPGSAISVSCSLVGSTPGTWQLSGGDSNISLGYTFGTSGTPAGSGAIISPDLLNNSNHWEGSAGFAKRKMSYVMMTQIRANMGNGTFEPVEDPQETNRTGTQPNDWISSIVIGEFKEYEQY